MKIWNYVWLALTMILIFTFAGFPTAFSNVLSYYGISFAADYTLATVGMTDSSLYTFMFAVGTGWLSVLIGGAVSIGLFVSGRSDIAIKSGFATTVLVMFFPVIMFPLIYSMEFLDTWVTALLSVIFIPLAGGFIVALVEFVAGGTGD